jgi:4-phospho-D-threonate 3-dehydrogenase / 4-phospho-D-erythronate 3-dehydrogenase
MEDFSHYSPADQIRRDRPRIGITMGDPSGIGPEVVLKAVHEKDVWQTCVPIIIGDAQLLHSTALKLNLQCDYKTISHSDAFPSDLNEPVIYDLNNIKGQIEPGVESGLAGRASAEYIEASVNLCGRNIIQAVATAPINKRALHLGGYPFPGHTEFFGHLTKTQDYAMAFASANLRIVLLSTHVPLAEAIRLIKRDHVAHIIKLANRELKRWGISDPRLAMAAVNPHGAEGGLFGAEESAELVPAVEECRKEHGINILGPFSADTVFLRASRGEFDAVIACYHDQAMIPIKCLSFGEAVNITMGLPFIRTSVDHGTAFDIAGKGVAEHSSMVEAIKMAAQLARAQSQ